MKITAGQIYRWSRFALILSIIVFALCALVAIVASPRYMGLYWTATYQARIVLFAISITAAICAISGFPLIRRRKTASKDETETRMSQIMQRLAPDERDYLQSQLDDRLVSLGEDGELVTVAELVDDKQDHD